ncbi:MAG TPA: hypothetical protein VHL98_07980 [Microvirga sp.]|jgi:hypothetical protein|nr:hypothetical protein [Microvirga sp.]
MSRDMIGGVIAAAGIWAIFTAGSLGLTPVTPRGHAWTVTGSEMIRSHPELVRIAPPVAPQAAAGERVRVPEG